MISKGSTILFLVLLNLSFSLVSQNPVNLDQYNLERKQIGSASMAVLGGFALGNLAIGIPNAIQLSGKDKYFNEMNCYWNVVNLGIGIGGYLSNQRKATQGLSMDQSVAEQSKTMKIYGLNAGLDVLYMGSGWALMAFANKAPKAEQRLLGYGESLLVQGGFLLLYDSTMLLIHGLHGKKLQKKDSGLSLSYQGIGVQYRF